MVAIRSKGIEVCRNSTQAADQTKSLTRYVSLPNLGSHSSMRQLCIVLYNKKISEVRWSCSLSCTDLLDPAAAAPTIFETAVTDVTSRAEQAFHQDGNHISPPTPQRLRDTFDPTTYDPRP
jgi:hypothetical protein